jgi:hypothetical protein
VFLECAEDTRLAVRTLQPEGRRPMDAAAAVRGRYLAPGDRVERGAGDARRVVRSTGRE